MGLKQEYFDDKTPGEFICSHCHDVFLEPVALVCHHMLCAKCFKKRMKRKVPVCPVCKKALCSSEEEIDTEWKEQYESLKVNCPKGCEKVLSLGNLNEHFANHCQLTFTLCINIGCARKVRRKDLALHLKQCEFRVVQCEGCGFTTKYVNLRMHQIVQKCLQRTNLHMIVQNRRQMNARVKQHRLKLQEESFQVELEERDLDRAKMWSAIARNDFLKRATTPNPYKGKLSAELPDKEQALSRLVHSAPTSPVIPSVRMPTSPTSTTKLCENCNKLFSEFRNHGEACRWHKGVSVCLRYAVNYSFLCSFFFRSPLTYFNKLEQVRCVCYDPLEIVPQKTIPSPHLPHPCR